MMVLFWLDEGNALVWFVFYCAAYSGVDLGLQYVERGQMCMSVSSSCAQSVQCLCF